MPELLTAIFSTWEFRPEVLIVPLVFGILYVRGWVKLNTITSSHRSTRVSTRQGPDGRVVQPDSKRLAEPWRLVSYLAGLALLLIALLSGLDAYASMLFSVHMVQHLLIIMIVTPLLWLGNPYPFVMWGLPRSLRLKTSRLLARPSGFRQGLRTITTPFIAWIVLIAATWVWHDSKMYDATLRNSFIHDLEHLTFFIAGMLFWWHAVGASPFIHRPLSHLKRTGYVIAAMPPNMVLGAAIAFAAVPLYEYYTTVPRIFGISVMEDQMIGGVIMWVPGTMMYLIAALVLGAQHLRMEEKKAPLPHVHWASDEALPVPGIENKKPSGTNPVG